MPVLDLFYGISLYGSARNVGANVIIDADAEKLAFIFQLPKDGTVSHLHFQVATSTAADTLRVGFQSIDGDGVPSGTFLSSGTVTYTGDNNVHYRVALVPGYVASQGDVIAMVLQFDNRDSGNVSFRQGSIWTKPLPHIRHFTSAWSVQSDKHPVMSLEYSDGSVWQCPGSSNGIHTTADAFASDDSPDEVGIVFKSEIAGRISGAVINFGEINDDFDIVCYDTDDTVLSTVSYDLDNLSGAAGASLFTFDEDIDLKAGQLIRIIAKPTTVTANNVSLNRCSGFINGEALAAYQGAQGTYRTSRTDAGAWTDDVLDGMKIFPVFYAFGTTLATQKVVNLGGF